MAATDSGIRLAETDDWFGFAGIKVGQPQGLRGAGLTGDGARSQRADAGMVEHVGGDFVNGTVFLRFDHPLAAFSAFFIFVEGEGVVCPLEEPHLALHRAQVDALDCSRAVRVHH